MVIVRNKYDVDKSKPTLLTPNPTLAHSRNHVHTAPVPTSKTYLILIFIDSITFETSDAIFIGLFSSNKKRILTEVNYLKTVFNLTNSHFNKIRLISFD